MRSLDVSAGRLGGVLEVLVTAGRVLTTSSDIGDALGGIAELCVAGFADHCSIAVAIDALEREEFAVSAGVHPEQPSDQMRIVEELVAGRRVTGTISCETRDTSGFDEATCQAVRLLAVQLAIVVAGHAAALREHRVADRFQRALLPDRLPDIPGVSFSAAYRPASEEAEVGGDWYDAFPLPDGRTAISVGDVAGHGLDAAVIMGEVRQAIRTASVGAHATPAAVLEYVNEVIRFRETIGMVTAIFGTYDPVTSVLSYAIAGHPPPLLSLDNGPTRRLPAGGLPLGCAQAVESTTWTFTVPQGARVVFYTDGLIENDRDIVAGEERLLEAVRTLDFETIPDSAAEIQRRVFGEAANRDDAAVFLLARSAPVPSYVFSALPVTSPLVRAVVERELEPLDLSEDKRFGVLVAVGEAIANAVEHAYRGAAPGLIRLGFGVEDNHFVATIEDFGRWRPFVRREERGRGIELMHAFMDGVQIRSTRESTSIVLKAKLGADERGYGPETRSI